MRDVGHAFADKMVPVKNGEAERAPLIAEILEVNGTGHGQNVSPQECVSIVVKV